MSYHTFSTEKDFVSSSVKVISDIISGGSAKIGLSGGKTPLPVYRQLANESLNFQATSFYVVDERYVDVSSSDSNYKMLVESLGSAIAESAGFFGFDTSLSKEESLRSYEEKLKSVMPLDLCILGLGTDGHVASLFRLGSALKETEKLVANTHTYEFAVYERLTMTFPAIMQSKKILLLVAGKKKKEVIDFLLHKDFSVDDFPAKKLLEHKNLEIYFGDYIN